ncbi:MAG: hypothetical protein V3V01_04450 [Acidimicrobiales bacterium]
MNDDTTTAPQAGEVESSSSAADQDERLAYRGVFQRLLIRPEVGAVIGAAAIWMFFWAVTATFGNAGGTATILDVSATLGIMAVAVALLMIGGEFDLSSGAATGTLGIITILLVKDIGEIGGAGLSLWIAIPISFVAALGLGWFNGTMVERTSLPSFIVTLATFFILRGFKLGFSKLTIDNISVGRIDEGAGYDFWRPIFDATWGRNNHQFGARDLIYTVAILGGLSLLAIAIHEANFVRRGSLNPAGLAVFMAGVAGGIAGVLTMHGTDGVGANTIAGLIIWISIVVGFFGLGLWRYERLDTAGPLSLDSRVIGPLVAGLVGLGAAIGFALLLDVDSQETLIELTNGFWQWLIVAAAGVLGVASTLRNPGPTGISPPLALKGVFTGVAAALGMYSFMFMATEQGLRAILFLSAALFAVVSLAIAASRAGRISAATRSFVLVIAAAVVAILAWFIRNESSSKKFRSEGFTILMVAAFVLFSWAIMTSAYAQRRSPDAKADRVGSLLAAVGMSAIAIGVLVRLLYTTAEEIAAGIPPAQFRMSSVWFIGVTAMATWLLSRTKFGSWIFAVGGNKQAARQIGVPAARTKTQLFMIVSVAAWLVGLLLAFRLNTLQSGTGNGLEFEYIIAAVVGGTLLTGGYGSAFGAAIGAIIMAMSKQGIPAARWNSDWRFAFLGLILLVAVIGNNFIRSKAESAR